MSGFESNRFIDLNEREENHLKCGICLNIFNNAVNNQCGHTFCKQCIENWIKANHTECPECRQPLVRHKSPLESASTSDNDIQAIIRGFVFYRNLKINSIISELKTKCDFEFNGCQEVLEFGILSSHLNKCQHKLCKNCNKLIVKVEEHNCFELMREEMNEWKLKYEESEQRYLQLKQESTESEQTVQELTHNVELLEDFNSKWKLKFQILKNLNNKLMESESTLENRLAEVMIALTQKLLPLTQMIDYIVFGSFRSWAHCFQFFSDSFKMTFVSVNTTEDRLKRNIQIPFIDIEKFMYCSDCRHPWIIIKTNARLCLRIQKSLKMETNHENDYLFDVNSNDPKHWFIYVKLNQTIEGFAINLIEYYCRLIQPNIITRAMDLMETRLWIQNIRKNGSGADDLSSLDMPVP